MPSTVITNIEQFATDGPLGPSLVIALGVALAALFAWILRREAGVLGRGNAALFWMLRTAALAAVLWMLLAPTNVRVETSTTRRTVAIVADVSGSMHTVDPAGAADEFRWTLSRLDDSRYPSTRAADRAVAALGVAERQLHVAADALRQHRRESLVVDAVAACDTALQRAREHLQSIVQTQESERLRSPAERLRRMLDDPEFQSFSQLSRALQRGRTPPEKDWRESLPDLGHRVIGIKTALEELSRAVAAEESQQLARNDPARLALVQEASRRGRVTAWLAGLYTSTLAPIRETADVKVSAFDQSLRWLPDAQSSIPTLRASSESPSTGTDLCAVFEALQQQQSLAAVFVLSDFAHNQPGDKSPLEVAAALTGTPVYVVPIGNSQHVRDIKLHSVFAPSVAMRNDDIVIEASLQAYDCVGEVCIAQLLQDGKVIDQREIVLDSAFASRTVRFEQHVPVIGTQSFQVAIAPMDGELTEDNNYRDFQVNVTRSDIKILLADELPRWEYRYLAQLFRRDPKVECDELLFRPRLIATGRREDSRTFPVTVDEWGQYDVVLLGDLPPANLPVSAQESLVKYLQQRGGTLVLIAGHDSMPHAYADLPLHDILPVLPVDASASAAPDGYEFRLTAEGRDHPALQIGESAEETRTAWDFVNRYLPLPTISTWRQPLASAHVLIAAVPQNSTEAQSDEQRSAFLCWQPIGRGRVIYLSAPESYRLRYLRGDRLHYRFWGQLLRWAIASDLSSGSEFVRIRTDKSRYQTRDTAHITLRLTDADGQPVVADGLSARVTQDNVERTVPLAANPAVPGEYAGEIHALSPGVYRIEPVGAAVEQLQQPDTTESASSSFTVQAELPGELADTRCDRALAQQIADVTGGQVAPPTAVDEILRLTNLAPEISEKIERRPLWLQWKYLWIVFGCLQTEWIIRKWLGMS